MRSLLYISVVLPAILGCTGDPGSGLEVDHTFRAECYTTYAASDAKHIDECRYYLDDTPVDDLCDGPWEIWKESRIGTWRYRCLSGPSYVAWHFGMRVELMPGLDDQVTMDGYIEYTGDYALDKFKETH